MIMADNVSKRINSLMESFRIPEIPTYDFQTLDISALKIDEEDTFQYQMNQQTQKIIEKSEENQKLLIKQNERLKASFDKLAEILEIKEKELEEAKRNERKSKKYNAIMLIISIVSMLIAVASWLLPDILGVISK